MSPEEGVCSTLYMVKINVLMSKIYEEDKYAMKLYISV